MLPGPGLGTVSHRAPALAPGPHSFSCSPGPPAPPHRSRRHTNNVSYQRVTHCPRRSPRLHDTHLDGGALCRCALAQGALELRRVRNHVLHSERRDERVVALHLFCGSKRRRDVAPRRAAVGDRGQIWQARGGCWGRPGTSVRKPMLQPCCCRRRRGRHHPCSPDTRPRLTYAVLRRSKARVGAAPENSTEPSAGRWLLRPARRSSSVLLPLPVGPCGGWQPARFRV